MNSIIIYIMGVAGSGKSTIGKQLSQKTSIPFFDADEFHSSANKEKMRTGIPLTDDDRAEWLRTLNELAKTQQEKNGAIIACSALKEKYRKALSSGITAPVFWVFLKGSYELILERMKKRTNHFMPPAMLSSQFETLEIPARAIVIDIADRPEKIIDALITQIFSEK
jgi:carbohydrate kinase (thermoresistant glucokinase family)